MSNSGPRSRSRSPSLAGLPNTQRLFDEIFSPERAQAQNQENDSLLSMLEDFDSQDTQRAEMHRTCFQPAPAQQLSSSAARPSSSHSTVEDFGLVLESQALGPDTAVLERAWATARDQCQGLPVRFVGYGVCSDEDVEAAIDTLLRDEMILKFYVGATALVKRRWLGGDDMPGHCIHWAYMAVLAVRGGAEGGQLEAKCIRMAKGFYSGCTNTALDSRHLGDGINFVYLVWR
jgi:hypothetical protein